MASKINLPNAYLQWLDGVGEEQYASFDDREWELADRQSLLETLEIDGVATPFIEQAKVYARFLAKITGESSTVDDDGNDIPFSRIEGFLVIGVDNEDLLCVDPSDGYSVWCFFPSEGGDVERLADSIEQWMKAVELTE